MLARSSNDQIFPIARSPRHDGHFWSDLRAGGGGGGDPFVISLGGAFVSLDEAFV